MEIRGDLDADQRAVLADWLCARGDPRGELLNLELALELDPGPGRAELSRRLASLRAELEPRWEQELASSLSLTPRQLHAGMPGRWYAGLLLEASLLPVGALHLPQIREQVLAWLLDSEVTAALERLDVSEMSAGIAIWRLAVRPRPRLRSLVLGSSGDVRLAPLTGRLPALQELELSCSSFDLSGFESPTLERLSLRVRHPLAPQLREGALPALRSLVVHVTSGSRFVRVDRPAVLPEIDALPSLRELALVGAPIDAPLIDALVRSPAFARLHRLELSDAVFDVAATRALRERAAAFAHLRRLDLREVELRGIESRGAEAALSDALPMLNLC